MSKDIKISETIYLLPELRFGGVQIFGLDLAYQNILDRKKVKIFSIGKSLSVLERYNLKKKNILKKHIYLVNIYVILKYLLKIVFSTKKVKVHTQGYFLSYIGFMSIFRNIHIIHTIQNQPRYEAGQIRSMLHSFFFRYLNIKTIANSKKISDEFKDYYGFDVDYVILNGVDADNINVNNSNFENFKIDKDEVSLLSVGSLGSHKNQKMLIESFIRLNDKKASLYIIGHNYDNYLSSEYINKIKKNRVFCLGEKDNSISFMRRCDIFCMSSRNEGLPLVLMEAKIHGMLAVITNVGGSKEVLNKNDYAVEKDDISGYTQALKDAISKSKNYKNKQRYIDTSLFSIKRCYEDYCKINFI